MFYFQVWSTIGDASSFWESISPDLSSTIATDLSKRRSQIKGIMMVCA